MIYGGGHPLSILVGLLGSILSVVAVAIGFVVVVGLILLLVRFLWFGTRAAQLYLVKNGESGRFAWPASPVGGAGGNPQGTEPASDTPGTAPDSAPRAPRKPMSAPPA